MWIPPFLTYLESECSRSRQTVETYRNCLEDFERYMAAQEGQPNWDTADSDLVRDWMVEMMEKGASARTVCKKLSALKTFYRYLLGRKLVGHDPVHSLQGPKKEKSLPVYVREADMNRLLDGDYFDKAPDGQRDRLILLILYSTGIRRSELYGLDWTDVDLEERQLKVTGKRNKQRIVPFGNELHDALVAYRQTLDQEPPGEIRTQALLVNRKTGDRLSSALIYKTVHDYLSLVSTQKKRSPHVLRHSFATAMLNNDANLEAVRELLGHESLATTEIYTHTTFEKLKRMYNQAHPRAK